MVRTKNLFLLFLTEVKEPAIYSKVTNYKTDHTDSLARIIKHYKIRRAMSVQSSAEPQDKFKSWLMTSVICEISY